MKKFNSTTFAIDFDGTCTTHEFPAVGKDIGAVPVLKRLVDSGHKLILWTMRADQQPKKVAEDFGTSYKGQFLTEAVNWFIINDIPLYGIQKNPTQWTWTKSPKCYAEVYIDDAALGCPLKQDDLLFKKDKFMELYGYSPFLSPIQSDGYCRYSVAKPYVDWVRVQNILEDRKLI